MTLTNHGKVTHDLKEQMHFLSTCFPPFQVKRTPLNSLSVLLIYIVPVNQYKARNIYKRK